MKHQILILACALVSPFAFAQTDPATSETEPTNPVTAKTEPAATTTTDGTVSAFAPDEMIAVKTADGEAIGFAIGSGAKYVNKAGNDVDASTIKEGSKVQVTAEKNGEQMVASRIVVED